MSLLSFTCIAFVHVHPFWNCVFNSKNPIVWKRLVCYRPICCNFEIVRLVRRIYILALKPDLHFNITNMMTNSPWTLTTPRCAQQLLTIHLLQLFCSNTDGLRRASFPKIQVPYVGHTRWQFVWLRHAIRACCSANCPSSRTLEDVEALATNASITNNPTPK